MAILPLAFLEGLRNKVTRTGERLGELLQTNRKLALFGLGGLLFFVLLCLISVLLVVNHGRGGAPDNSRELNEAFRPRDIPPGDLFLPEEPDFLPGVLPERERRESWTPEDARPFWTDPAENSGLWRDRIESMVDEYLEHVP
jgi:hypothetical protein